MPLNIPSSATQIFNQMSTDIVNELQLLNPYLPRSWGRAMTASMANATFEQYKTLGQLENQLFWDTTTNTFLERWAAFFGVVRLAETKSKGFVTFTGINNTLIPNGTQFTSQGTGSYSTLANATITNTTLSITSLSRVGTTASATTSINHGFSSNLEIVVAGANQNEYNGAFKIVVTGLKTFDYTITGSPSTPSTGTITATATYANVEAISDVFGSSQNLLSGTRVSLSSPIAGVDDQGFVSFDELSGGENIENDDSLRTRFQEKLQGAGNFNKQDIINIAKSVSGVTRVFVFNVDDYVKSIAPSSLTREGNFAIFETASPHGLFNGQPITIDGAVEFGYNVDNKRVLVIDNTRFGYVVPIDTVSPATGSPLATFGAVGLGQARIFFVKDNDSNIIPTPLEVQAVKNALVAKKIFTISEADLIVEAPVAVPANFTFSSLSPNTPSMQQAITKNLTKFFSSGTEVARNVTEADYKSIINSTIDSAGNRPIFSLSAPSGDVSININEISILGTITFPS